MMMMMMMISGQHYLVNILVTKSSLHHISPYDPDDQFSVSVTLRSTPASVQRVLPADS